MRLESKHGERVRGQRIKLAEWLRANPGPQRTTVAAAACGIPMGSLTTITKHRAFKRDGRGLVALTGESIESALKKRRYGPDLVNNTRWAIFAELTVEQPQCVSRLVENLKFSRSLIEQAVNWGRLRKTAQGYVIAD